MKINDLIDDLKELKELGYEDVLMSSDPEGNTFYKAYEVNLLWSENWLEDDGYTEEDRPQEEFLKSVIIWPGQQVEPH